MGKRQRGVQPPFFSRAHPPNPTFVSAQSFETRLENSRKQDAANLKHMMNERLNQLQHNVQTQRELEIQELKTLISHLSRAISKLDERVATRTGSLRSLPAGGIDFLDQAEDEDAEAGAGAGAGTGDGLAPHAALGLDLEETQGQGLDSSFV